MASRNSNLNRVLVLSAAALVACAGIPAIAQPSAPPIPRDAGGPKAETRVKVDENNLVDLHVADEDLATVLEMLSIQSQKNIIASKNVKGRVTANLYRVTFYEALDAILSANGLGYMEQGNFIYVYTAEELKEIADASRVRISKVIELNYLNSNDAAEFVKPLLSSGTSPGQIKTNGKTSTFPALGDTPSGSDDYAHNAMLVVFDYEDNVAEIERLLRSIDTRPAQILVEATILQTQLTEANAFGVDFSIVANMNFGDFVQLGGPTAAANALIGGRTSSGGSGVLPADRGGSAISSTVGNTAGQGGLKVGIVSNDVAVFMRVLDEVTDTTIVSNPKILTLNRQPSRVLVGRKVGYLSTTTTDTASTQSVEFLDTGTQLYFRPFVTSEGMIRMELKPQVSDAVIREISDATGAAVTIPDELTNELTTNVLVRDGQTVVLGGLFSETTIASRRQIPLLGDIPILGQAFRGNEDETSRSEIIFLVTPTIVNDQALAEAGQRALAHKDSVRAGSREGLLFWSRERRTAMLNLEAEELASKGDRDGALWKLRQSLFLNPQQPEAILMRERFGGDHTDWPSRSMLEDILGPATAPVVPVTNATQLNQTNTVSYNPTDATNTGYADNTVTYNENYQTSADATQTQVYFDPSLNTMDASSAHSQAIAQNANNAFQPVPAMNAQQPEFNFDQNSIEMASSDGVTTTTYQMESGQLQPGQVQTELAQLDQAQVDQAMAQNSAVTSNNTFGSSDFFANDFFTTDAWTYDQDALKSMPSWFAWATMSPNGSFARTMVGNWQIQQSMQGQQLGQQIQPIDPYQDNQDLNSQFTDANVELIPVPSK